MHECAWAPMHACVLLYMCCTCITSSSEDVVTFIDQRNHDYLFLCRHVRSLSLSACRERDSETRERKEEEKTVVIQSPFTNWLPEIAYSMISASPSLLSPPCSVQTGSLYNMMNRKWSDSNAQQVQHSMLLSPAIMTILTLPQPGGPHSMMDGMWSDDNSEYSMLSFPTALSWPT